LGTAQRQKIAYRYTRDLGDRLHLLDASNAHFRYPERARDMRPFVTRARTLHGTRLIGTEDALRPLAQRASATEPAAGGYRRDAVARLVHTNVAAITKHHFVGLLGVGRATNITDNVLVVLDAQALFSLDDGFHLFVASNLQLLDHSLELVLADGLEAHGCSFAVQDS